MRSAAYNSCQGCCWGSIALLLLIIRQYGCNNKVYGNFNSTMVNSVHVHLSWEILKKVERREEDKCKRESERMGKVPQRDICGEMLGYEVFRQYVRWGVPDGAGGPPHPHYSH